VLVLPVARAGGETDGFEYTGFAMSFVSEMGEGICGPAAQNVLQGSEAVEPLGLERLVRSAHVMLTRQELPS
jgi:hypothetical protein